MRITNKICPFCNKKISTINHLKKCNPIVDDNTSFKLMIEKTFKCNSKDIIDDYKNGLSLPDVKNKYGISYSYTKRLLKIFGESIRTISESSNENRLRKYKKTVTDKYGTDNVSKSEKIKKKKATTFIKNYGVDNIFKTDGFTEYVTDICLKKYGKKRMTNPKLISEKRLSFSKEKWKLIERKRKNTIQENVDNGKSYDIFSSNLELIIKDIFDKNNIKIKHQKFINGVSYDFHIINTNIIVEVNGDYWHANPEQYKKNDIVNISDKLKLAKDVWEKDELKLLNANKYNYRVITIWESEINRCVVDDILEEFVLNLLLEHK